MRPATFLWPLALGAMVAAWLVWLPSNDGASSDDQYPNEYEWVKRTWPHFAADPAVIGEAATQAHAMRQRFNGKNTYGQWENVGPANISGRISDVAYDPLHPDTIWAGAATGGVLKSIDGGRTWAFVFDTMPTQLIGDIAVDPVSPSTVYVGTGEANGGHNNYPGLGVFKTDDGGLTWRSIGLESTSNIGRIIVDSLNHNRVWVAAIGSYFDDGPHRGVYRSLNGGESWEKVLFINDSTGVIDLVANPADTDILYAASWHRVRRVTGAQLAGAGSAIYKSEDGGDTWSRLSGGLPSGDHIGRIGLTLCPSDPNILYALYNHSYTHLGLFRSDNAGASWKALDSSGYLGNNTSDFTWYFGNIRVDPRNCDHIFVLDVQFLHSWDAGENWLIEHGMHVDHHALAFHSAEAATLIGGNDGGLAKNIAQPFDFERIGGVPNIQFYEIGLDPSNPDRFFGGTQDNGTLRNGGPDGWYNILGGDGFYVIVDPGDDYVVYAESQWGRLVKFVNWQPRSVTNGIDPNEETNWSTPVVIDPQNNKVLYYGTSRLYRTTNAATSWQPISDHLVRGSFALNGTISTIAVSPVDSNTIWVGTDDGYIWVTDDYGITWDQVATELPVRWVTRVVADPVDPKAAYVTFSGLRWRDSMSYVFRTRDNGASWTDLTANLPESPVNAFAVDLVDPQVLYLGNDVGAFVSKSGGKAWEPLGEGMPVVPVADIKVFYDGTHHHIVAGTHGRSMYKLDVPAMVSRRAAAELPIQSISLDAAYPNPFESSIRLEYQVSYPAHVTIEVLDALGRRVDVITNTARGAGQHELSWAPGHLAAGVYFIRLLVNGQFQSVRPITRY